MPNGAKGTKIAWNFNRLNDGVTEIFVYDVIADKQSTSFLSGEKGAEVTPKLFGEELNKADTPELCIRINSQGGDVFAAEAIRTQIREKRAQGKKVTCKIDGLCASAAVGIAAACETVLIPSSAYFMVHDPAVFAYGYFDSAEFEKAKNMLDKVKDGIVSVYSEKTGKDKQEISGLMTAETWYTGEEAVQNGFCDGLLFEEASDPAVTEVFNAALYKNCPAALCKGVKVHADGLQAKEAALNGFQAKEAALKDLQFKKREGAKNMETSEQLKAAYPELAAQIEASAATAERKRIQDIENLAVPGYEEIINKAKFETPVSAAEVAMQILAEQKKLGSKYLKNAEDDVKNSGINNVAPEGFEPRKKTNPFDAAIDSVLPLKR